VIGAVAAAVMLGGCGAAVTSVPSMKVDGDTASFLFRGSTTTVTESGFARIHYKHTPEMNHAGPLGCRGRYFTANYSEHIEMQFHYSAANAFLNVGISDLYRFGPPRRQGNAIVFERNFARSGPVRVTVHCPPPPPGSRIPTS